jgi:hypothetical protein
MCFIPAVIMTWGPSPGLIIRRGCARTAGHAGRGRGAVQDQVGTSHFKGSDLSGR